MVPERLHLRGAEAAAKCDQNTIGVVAILGSTMDGSYEPVLEISQALDRLQAERGFDVPVHVDGASGGFIAPFLQPDLEWDFPGAAGGVDQRLGTQVRAGVSRGGLGHVAELGSPLPEESASFRVNYLGGQMPTFALNFSRPGAQVAAEYYNFIRLGHEGYRHVQQTCQDVALHLSGEIGKMGPFELLSEGRDLPVFAFKLRNEVTGYSVFDLSERLRQRGWQVPAYTFPADMTDTSVMRIVVRNGFSMDLASLLLADFRLHLRILEHHPQTQPPPEIQQMRQAFNLTGASRAAIGLRAPGRGRGRRPGRDSGRGRRSGSRSRGGPDCGGGRGGGCRRGPGRDRGRGGSCGTRSVWADGDVDGAAIAVGEVLSTERRRSGGDRRADGVHADGLGCAARPRRSRPRQTPPGCRPPPTRWPTAAAACRRPRPCPCCRPAQAARPGDSRADVRVLDPSWPAGTR